MKFKAFFALGVVASSLLVLGNLLPAGEVAAAAGATASCNACHQGKRSFTGRDAEALAAAIRSIRDGELKHPALGLSDDSDVAIAALAAKLSEK